MKFYKMHGTGNDYVYIDCFSETIEDPARLAVKISDRHFGVGSDGLILIKPSDVADCFMDMYNADGSRGKMCGNGIRCVARYLYDQGMAENSAVTIETLSGIKHLRLNIRQGKLLDITVDMGEPVLVPQDIPLLWPGTSPLVSEDLDVGGRRLQITCVSMGNPHTVIFVDDVDDTPVEEIGRIIENLPMYPDKTNVEFIQIIDRQTMKMRVWERGSGETMACGTGACASVVAAVLNGRTDREVLVHLRGGDLKIEWQEKTGTVHMTGPASRVFFGYIDEDFF
ncbi:MAG: diaminopimelate epimerase [Saccharofermentanales bacterium]